MSQGHRTLLDRMVLRLQLATRWVSGAELAQGLSHSPAAIEDALADLVADGHAQYRASHGFRLNASQLCRDSVRTLQRDIRASEQKCVFRRRLSCQAFEDICRVGVAEYRPGIGTLTYELELRLPDDGGDINKRVEQLLTLIKSIPV